MAPSALHDAIKASCDVYFYETAHRLGIDRLAVTGRALGLGHAYESELAGQKRGVMPDTAWKRATLGVPWYAGETISCGIGQGYVLATPLQLAVVSARIASGKAIEPRFVRSHGSGAQPAPAPLPIDPVHLQLVRDGMSAVVNEKGGTATRSVLSIPSMPGILMAGKTGTAQAFGHGAAHHFTGWEAQPHALFIAFAPVDAPRYAVACVVEHGGYGAHAAAPIVHDVMTELLLRDPAGKPAFAREQPGRGAIGPCRRGGHAMNMLFADGFERPQLKLSKKLLLLNWPFLLLITAITAVGVAALYSVAGGSLEPWASRHVVRFCIGLALIYAVVAGRTFAGGCAWPIPSISSCSFCLPSSRSSVSRAAARSAGLALASTASSRRRS